MHGQTNIKPKHVAVVKYQYHILLFLCPHRAFWLINVYYHDTNKCTCKWFKINTKIAPTCFGVLTPSSGSLQIVPAKAKCIDRRTESQRPQPSVRVGTRRSITTLDIHCRLHFTPDHRTKHTPNQRKSIKSINIIYHIPYDVTFVIMLYIIHCRLELHMRPRFTND